MRAHNGPIARVWLFAITMLLPGCGLFIIFADRPAPLSAAVRADRYQLFRAPSWANQTALRVLPIGGVPPYTYEWAVVAPTGRALNECLDSADQNIAQFTANGTDGPYAIRCIVEDSIGGRYAATTTIQVGGEIGLDITTDRVGVVAGGGPFGQTSIRLNPKFGVPPFRVTWVCTGPDGKIDNDRLDVSDPMVPRFTSSSQVGQYVLTASIMDSQGQTATQSFIIVVGQDLGLDVAAERTTVLPGGGEAGMVRLVATPIGGTEPYEYDWEIIGPDGQNRSELLWDTQTRSPIFESDSQTGTFIARCAVTDGAGTVLIGSASITVGEQITLDITADRLSLPAGSASGQQAHITANVHGGHNGITITWEATGPDGADTSALLSRVEGDATVFTPGELAGTYMVRCTATDGEGMSASDSLTLSVGGTLGVVVSTGNPWPATGGLVPTGAAYLSTRVYGGTPPYQYSWEVTDPSGQLDSLRLNDATVADPTFTSALLAGRYFVVCTVTDSLGETTADGVLLNVGQPLNVDVSVDKQSLTGGGGVSGRAQFITTVNGGVAPYRYQWTVYDPAGSADPERLSNTQIPNPVFTSALSTGTYRATLTTTDAMGVVFVDSVELVVGSTGGGAAGQNLSASVEVDRQTIASGGETAGAIALTTGGVPPLSYVWSVTDPAGNPADACLNSMTADTVVFTSNALQGTYRLRCTVSDVVGNMFTDSVQVTVSDEFNVALTNSETHTVPDGTVNLAADRTGGSGPFTYTWTCFNSSGNPAGNFSFGATGAGRAMTAGVDDVSNVWRAPTGLAAMGSYRLTVTATDSMGRSFTDSTTVIVTDSMIVQLAANRVYLAPGQSINLTADRTGGSANFTYTWSSRNSAGNLAGTFTSGATGTGLATQTAANDVSNTWTAPAANPGTLGTYRINVSAVDANGIASSDTLMVIVDDPFSLDLRSSDAAIPAGGTTTLTADRTGGERNFSFVWTARNSAGATAGTFSSGPTGTGTATQNNRTNDAPNNWTAPAGIVDTYTITCVATDALGKTFTDNVQVRAGEDNALVLSLSANTVYAAPGETVTLTADQQNGVANFGYAWIAVDEGGAGAGVLGAANQSGVAGDASNPWTAPTALGTYRIRATVTDSIGRQASDTVHVIVRSPLALDLQSDAVMVTPGTAVALAAQPIGGQSPFACTWQAVDGSGTPSGDFTTGAGGTGFASQTGLLSAAVNGWSVSSEGSYTISCTVTDGAGQVFSQSLTVAVTINQTLLLDLSADTLSLAPGETVGLTATRIGGSPNYNYAWTAVDELGVAAGSLGATNQNGLPGDATNSWTAPAIDGTYRINCRVMDAVGRRASVTVFARVSSLAIQNIFLAPAAPDTTSILPDTPLSWLAGLTDPGVQFTVADGLVNPAQPRNVVVMIQDSNDSISGGFVRVTGRDARGFAQSEVITIGSSSGSFSRTVGQRPFATIERVDAFGFDMVSIFPPDTISIGLGEKFGLTGLLRSTSDVAYVYEGSSALTSGYIFDLTSGQQGITFASAPNGARNYMVVFRAR